MLVTFDLFGGRENYALRRDSVHTISIDEETVLLEEAIKIFAAERLNEAGQVHLFGETLKSSTKSELINGILILVNDVDVELLREADSKEVWMKQGDRVSLITTLHGG